MKRCFAVYCASSEGASKEYGKDAFRLGEMMAENGHSLVYGGGHVGLMGQLANGVISKGGTVTGVIPVFFKDRNLGHNGISKMIVVPDLHVRQRTMLEMSDFIVALPGGCGTFYELIEAITWKMHGLIDSPIVIYNQLGFYDPMIEMLERSIEKGFMTEENRSLWTVVDSLSDLIDMANSDLLNPVKSNQ